MRFMKHEKDTMLTILETTYKFTKTRKRKYYICLCECGNKKEIRADGVDTLKVRSCGCYTNFIKTRNYFDYHRSYDVQNIIYYNDTLFVPIYNFNGYYASLDGKIYGERENNILKEAVSKKGYLRLCLINNKRERITLASHRLIAKTFILNPKNLETVNHKNFNRKDNRASNLEWMSFAENNLHKEEAIQKELREHKGRKLNVNKVIHIRKSNKDPEMLAKMYDVTPRYIEKIRAYKYWRGI